MPCNTDHMEPTVKERQQQDAAKVLFYVKTALGRTVPGELRAAAEDVYGRGIHPDNVVRMLCECFRSMTDAEMNRIVYDGRNREARRAADWWEEHQAEDAKRMVAERKAAMAAKYKNHVFAVFANADMTEGRGPMKFVAVYRDLDDGLSFIQSQKGVMGSRTGLKHHEERRTGDRVTSPEHWSANDHDLRPVEVR